MKCPECFKEGKESCIKIGECSETCLACPPFYDEEGAYHVHDSNVTTQYYACTEGHSWSAHEPNKCPNPECVWTSESRKEAMPEIKEDTAPLTEIRGDGGAVRIGGESGK